VGTMTAVYGWYPDRYGAKDALRLGNYNLLACGREHRPGVPLQRTAFLAFSYAFKQ
jgi:hypothetical protein